MKPEMMTTMNTNKFTIAAAQSSSVEGDIPQNLRHHAELVVRAAGHQANVIVFPELSLTGYEPTLAAELALDARDAHLAPLQELSDQLGVTIIAGCPVLSDEAKPYIGAFIIRPQLHVAVYRNRFLHPGEEQHFIPSEDVVVCNCHGRAVGIAICADISHPRHAADVSQQNATIFAAGLAYTPKGIAEAEAAMSGYAREHRFLAVMANYASPTGGYPMAGRSAIWDESGAMIAQAGATGESLVLGQSTPNGWTGRLVKMIGPNHFVTKHT
jgi:predicted amidohydrolase